MLPDQGPTLFGLGTKVSTQIGPMPHSLWSEDNSVNLDQSFGVRTKVENPDQSNAPITLFDQMWGQ